MTKRILSILLAACMFLTMMPVTVMAEATEIVVDGTNYSLDKDGLQEAINGAPNGCTVRLGGNINLVNDGVAVSSGTEKSIYLDLNGYTITYSGSVSAVNISGSASLTVQDSSTGGTTGKITSAANCRIIKNTGSGTLTITGGIIEGTGNNTFGIANEGPGKLSITGGTVQTSNMYALLIGNNSGDVEISGGTVRTSDWGTINHQGTNANLTISGNALIECKASNEIISIGNNINPGLTIDGGTILGSKGIYVGSANCRVEVNGGYIQSKIYGKNITVKVNGGFLGAGLAGNGYTDPVTGIVNGGYVKSNGFGSLYYKNEADVELKNYFFSLRDANNTVVYGTVVTGLTTDPSLDYEYGLNDVRTDDYGDLHIWLPGGKTWASVTAGGQTYSGEIDNHYSATLRLPSLNPAASITTAAKGNASSTSVDFTLTSAPTGTWKVYASADVTEVMAGVTAALSGNTLTLVSSSGSIEPGYYYVSVTEPNKNESVRLELTVVEAPPLIDAEAPVITNDLSTTPAEYHLNEEALPLEVTAEVSDGGTLSYEWFSHFANNTFGAISLGVTAPTYTPSTTALGTTYYFCVVTNTNDDATGQKTTQTISNIACIKVVPTEISSATVNITAPAAGATPQNEAQAEAATNNSNFTVTGITWNGALTAGGKFKANQVYTATVTLVSKNNHKFQSAAFTPTVAGSASVGLTTVSGENAGNTVTFTVTFPETGALAVEGIIVKDPPATLSYTSGENLDLTGLVVTLTYNDSSTEDVPFENFPAKGITASPAHGTKLTMDHDNTPITLTCSGFNAYTGNLTVNPGSSKAINAFDFKGLNPNVTGTINEAGKTISLTVPYGTDVTSLVPTITHTGTSISPDTGVVQDFTSPVEYTVAAEDGSTQKYTVTVTVAPAPGGSTPTTPAPTPVPAPAITVTEVKSELFTNNEDIHVEADVENAFGQPVEVKITDDEESQNEIFKLVGADDEVYPFDISLYSKASGEKVQPREGYSVKITLPVSEQLLDVKEKINVVYVKDGKLEVLSSQLIEKDGKWYITFEAVHFSPYALVVSTEPWVNPFVDVKENDWYYPAIRFVAQNGLMVGTGSNTFSPGITTNRAMIVAILYRLSGSPETLESTFSDVASGAYYAKAVAWAQNQGFISGYGNGMFGPEDSITREQMAAILWRYEGRPEADTTVLTAFKDAGEISGYAKEALAWAYSKGIIAGKGNGILDPRGFATRAETAIILLNYLKTE